jgi:cytochrome c-type biogenesis protein CcmH/NrfG
MLLSFRSLGIAAGIVAACLAITAAQLSAAAPEKGKAPDKTGEAPVPAPAAAPKIATPDNPELQDALKKFLEGKADESRKMLDLLSYKDSDQPPADIWFARWFIQLNQQMAARATLDKARKDAEVYVILGNTALQDRRITDAELDYNKANELLSAIKSNKRQKDLQPQIVGGLASVAEARASMEKATSKEALEQWALAQKYLESLVKMTAAIAEKAETENPLPKDAPAKDVEARADRIAAIRAQHAGALRRLAFAQFQQEDGPKVAYQTLKKACTFDKNLPAAEVLLAILYEQVPDHKSAKKWMAYGEGQAPKDLRTRVAIGEWAIQSNELDEAKKQANEALGIDKNSVPALVLSGAVSLMEHKWSDAEKPLQNAYLLDPGSFSAANNYVLALCEQEDKVKQTRALQYAKNLAQNFPNNVEAASTFGRALFRSGNMQEAGRVFQQVANANPQDPDTIFYLADFLAATAVNSKEPKEVKKQAKDLLKRTLDTKRPFLMKKEAKALLDKLENE